ncbi:MAG: STAS domain-containing protein [Bacteroidales bacterium]|nr:STAS domain-containing protein [Bacteroidales bacterium]
MEIDITRENEEVIVRLSGRLDTPGAQEIAPKINDLLEETGKTVILDCSDMSYISSSGLRIFLTLRKSAADKGGRIIVRNICNDVRNVFMMTGFLNLFEIE